MHNTIIGSGLLAQHFESSQSENCLFFCSGVSNSTETRTEQFLREKLLLEETISDNKEHNKVFIYFSSVLAPTRSNEYYQHKHQMESIIQNSCHPYLILRLPQIAGAVSNSTLLPTFTRYIYQGVHFKIFKNAARTIIDIQDLVKLFDQINKYTSYNKVINICPGYLFYPEELAIKIAKKLRKKPGYELMDKGTPQECNLGNSLEDEIIRSFFADKDLYLDNVVDKYVPLIIQQLNK